MAIGIKGITIIINWNWMTRMKLQLKYKQLFLKEITKPKLQ